MSHDYTGTEQFCHQVIVRPPLYELVGDVLEKSALTTGRLRLPLGALRCLRTALGLLPLTFTCYFNYRVRNQDDQSRSSLILQSLQNAKDM